MLAVILEASDLQRVYTALSLLVCTASDGEPARGLVTFGALHPLLKGRFPRHLDELWTTARELDDLTLHACAAAIDIGGWDRAKVERVLDGVMSTPRFLSETKGARLVVV